MNLVDMEQCDHENQTVLPARLCESDRAACPPGTDGTAQHQDDVLKAMPRLSTAGD